MKATAPKSPSGNVSQLPNALQTDGASVIHSAEVVSGRGEFIVKPLSNCPPLVASWSASDTRRPDAETRAKILSPDRIRIFSVTGAAGTSSYQA